MRWRLSQFFTTKPFFANKTFTRTRDRRSNPVLLSTSSTDSDHHSSQTTAGCCIDANSVEVETRQAEYRETRARGVTGEPLSSRHRDGSCCFVTDSIRRERTDRRQASTPSQLQSHTMQAEEDRSVSALLQESLRDSSHSDHTLTGTRVKRGDSETTSTAGKKSGGLIVPVLDKQQPGAHRSGSVSSRGCRDECPVPCDDISVDDVVIAADGTRNRNSIDEKDRVLRARCREQQQQQHLNRRDQGGCCAPGIGVSSDNGSISVVRTKTKACELSSIEVPTVHLSSESPTVPSLESRSDACVLTSEDKLESIAELGDYFLGRGLVTDPAQAAGAAQICLSLLVKTVIDSKSSGSLRQVDAGPVELLALACTHLVGLPSSTDATACLLTWLIERNITVARLALQSSKPRPCSGFKINNKQNNARPQHRAEDFFPSTAAAAGADSVSVDENVEGVDGEETVHLPQEGEIIERETAQASEVIAAAAEAGAIAGEAATALCETGRVWGEVVEILEGDFMDCGGSDLRGELASSSVRLKHAIRVLTTGAASCYGQLVVLGYTEFSVRDSTWYPIGPKNTRFALAKRDVPNGVRLPGNGSYDISHPKEDSDRNVCITERPEGKPMPHEMMSPNGGNAEESPRYSVGGNLDHMKPGRCSTGSAEVGSREIESASTKQNASGDHTGGFHARRDRTSNTAGAESTSEEQHKPQASGRALAEIFVTPKRTRTVSSANPRGSLAQAPTRARGNSGSNATSTSSRTDQDVYRLELPEECTSSGGSRNSGECLWRGREGGRAPCCAVFADAGAEGNDRINGGLTHRVCLSLSSKQREEALGAGPMDSLPRHTSPAALRKAWEGPSALKSVPNSGSSSPSDVGSDLAWNGSAAAVQGGGEAVEIRCREDPGTDMFQLGRMQGYGNDFAVRGPLHQSTPGGKVCGPVSRYAVRLLVDRSPPHRCRIYTGGFNGRKCLVLPKTSPKWITADGGWDAVTTFGVRILKPEIGEWREVTVAGAIRRPRIDRLDAIGELMSDETNELTTGTIIDVGGIQMIYESAANMVRLEGIHPSRVLKALNDLRPQCPVQLQTLHFKSWCGTSRPSTPRRTVADRKRTSRDTLSSSQTAASPSAVEKPPALLQPAVPSPFEEDDHEQQETSEGLVPHIFPACGHVHGYAPQLARGPCPMCRTPGALVEMAFGWCSTIDSSMPAVVFNPCGHVASMKVAERWASTQMPNNAPPDAVYRPICPYCAKPLLRTRKGGQPYSKIILLQ